MRCPSPFVRRPRCVRSGRRHRARRWSSTPRAYVWLTKGRGGYEVGLFSEAIQVDGKRVRVERLTPAGWKLLQTVVVESEGYGSRAEKDKLRFKVPKGTTSARCSRARRRGRASWPATATSCGHEAARFLRHARAGALPSPRRRGDDTVTIVAGPGISLARATSLAGRISNDRAGELRQVEPKACPSRSFNVRLRPRDCRGAWAAEMRAETSR